MSNPTPDAPAPESELLARITNYLGNGGLFNPECMEHDKVRDLIMDCRAALQKRVAAPQSEERPAPPTQATGFVASAFVAEVDAAVVAKLTGERDLLRATLQSARVFVAAHALCQTATHRADQLLKRIDGALAAQPDAKT